MDEDVGGSNTSGGTIRAAVDAKVVVGVYTL